MVYYYEEYSSPSNSIVHPSNTESEIIGYFSIDENRTYLPDSSTLLYYNPPKADTVHLDLNEGIESVVPLQASVARERLDYLLKWIKLNRNTIEAPRETDRWIQPNFVGPAGLFSRMLSTPFTLDDNWAILAAKWKGTIYLYVDKTNKVDYIPENDAMKFIHWGYKFEQYVLSELPNKVPDTFTPVPVIESKEFRCVYQCRLGDYEILFDNVMKGVCSEKQLTDPLPLENLKFIETKTSITVEHPGQEKTLRQWKFLRWWSRCFLTNIESVACGFRDNNGIVRKLETYSLHEMITLSKYYWNPSTCIDFCKTLLRNIAEAVIDDCNETIYRFERMPKDVFQIKDIIEATKLSPSSENAVLPMWYMEETQKCSK